MSRYTPAARAWIACITLAALAVTLVRLRAEGVTATEGLALALLVLCAGLANAFPIRTAFGGATYQLTGMLFVAGAVILRPAFCSLLPLLALAPALVGRQRRPGAPLRWLFNSAQTALAMHAANG